MRIRTQLLLALGSLAAIPVILFGVAQARAAVLAAADTADRETLLAGTSLARELGYLIDAEANVTRTFAGEVGAAARLDVDVSGIRARQYLDIYPSLYGAMILDLTGLSTGGAVVDPSGARKAAIGLSYGDRSWVREIVGGAPFSAELVRSRVSGHPAVSFAAPVKDAAGTRLGLVALGIDLQAVQRALQRVTEAAPGLTSVVLDDSGRVVAAAGSDNVKPLERLTDVRLYDPPVDEVERREGVSETGELRRGTAAAINAHVVKWWVTTTLPVAAVRKRAIPALLTMTAFACAALGIGLGAAVVLARAFAHPVQRLSKLAEAIGHGDLRTRPDRTRAWYPRELGELIASTDGMLSRLQALIRQVAHAAVAIAEVTDRLRHASKQMLGDSSQQHEAVQGSSGAIVQMSDSIRDVSDSVQSLSQAASGAIDSISSLERQIDRIAASAHTLADVINGAAQEGARMDLHVEAVATSTSQLRETVERTSGSLRLLTESIQQVASGAAQGEALAHAALSTARFGRDAVSGTTASIHEIQTRFGAVGDAVLRLSRRSAAIGDVVRVIDEVTRATRLLAINASIISSEAGDQGKGFAVVADRVRAMASNTAASTTQITDLVASVQADIRHAVEAVHSGQETVRSGEERSREAGVRLQAIIDGAGEAEKTVQKIARASRDQASRVGLVVAALTEVHEATTRISSAADAQRNAQQTLGVALAKVRSVGNDVRASTEYQQRDSRAVTAAVRGIIGRLRGIAQSSDAQSRERNRIQDALVVFEDTANGSVERSRQLGETMRILSERLEQLQDHLSAFRVE